MARVWVRAPGPLPPLCARTGQRCITRYRAVVTDLPSWAEWLGWSGLWPLQPLRRSIAAWRGVAGPPQAEVSLPLLPSRRARSLTLRTARDVSLVTTLALLVASWLLDGTVALLVRTAAAGTAGVHLLVAALGLWLTVGARTDRTGERVELSRVHRQFAAAAQPQPAASPR